MRSALFIAPPAMLKRLLFLCALLVAAPAAAQTFPELSGRVVDAADLLSPAQEAELSQRLEALEQASTRQLVVATVPSLEDRPIEDYGYQLGRHWKIGQSEANNGTILLVAPNERKVRIEVGYGLEPIITDALSHQIIQQQILPRFREGDMAGGIMAGASELITQLGAPPEQAEQRAIAAADAQRAQGSDSGESPFGLIVWAIIFFFVILPMLFRGRRGRRHGRRRRRGAWDAPVVIWGGGSDWGSGGGGWGGGGGGFGGFSGGGGSFGGGGASGSW